jgi:peptidoglycan/LPS O-acetylase OafA/YrhL
MYRKRREYQDEDGRPRLAWVDVTRGSAILLVIATHAIDLIDAYIGDGLHVLTVIKDAADPFRMATLMFLSGLLLSASLRKSRSRYFQGKLSRIGWPYLVWSLVYLGLQAVATPWRDGDAVTINDLALIFYAPPSFLWYLAYLMIFYFVAMCVPKKVRPWLVPTCMVGSALTAWDGNWQTMLYLFAFFLAGDYATNRPELWARLTQSGVSLSVCCVLLAGTVLASALGIDVRYQAVWAPCVLAGVVVACPVASAISASWAGRIARSAGEQSVVYYVVHWPVLMLVFFASQRLGVRDPYALAGLLVAMSVVAGAGLAWAQKNVPVAAWLFQMPLLERANPKVSPATAG